MLENLQASSRKRTNQEARRQQKYQKREKGTGKNKGNDTKLTTEAKTPCEKK
jgi:hypothetical protein